MGLSENVGKTPLYPMVLLMVNDGFADHYPYEKWLMMVNDG